MSIEHDSILSRTTRLTDNDWRPIFRNHSMPTNAVGEAFMEAVGEYAPNARGAVNSTKQSDVFNRSSRDSSRCRGVSIGYEASGSLS